MPFKSSVVVCFIFLAFCLQLVSCGGQGDSEDISLAPYLYEESLEIDPNPINLYEEAIFYMGWEDHDGDLENGTITVRLVTDEDEVIMISYEDLEIEGDKSGSLSFTVEIMDGYQGTYYIIAQDEDGNISNEVSVYLYLNDPNY